MTTKLRELRDREWNKRCNLKYDIGSLDDIARAEFNAGFDAATADLLPVIQSLLPYLEDAIQCGENHFSANMKKEKNYLKELGEEFGIDTMEKK